MNEFLKAFASLQAELPVVPKDTDNTFFKSKYADLAGIVRVIQPLLTKHGFVYTHTISVTEQGQALTTTLYHVGSMGKIESTMLLTPVKQDPQGYGSAATYARRYTLSGLLGIVTDEDDDGNSASGRQEMARPAPAPHPKKSLSPVDMARAIWTSFSELGWKKEEIAAHFKEVTGKDDMKSATADDVKRLEAALAQAKAVKEVQRITPAEVVMRKVEGADPMEDLVN